jgi:hypothetical protein
MASRRLDAVRADHADAIARELLDDVDQANELRHGLDTATGRLRSALQPVPQLRPQKIKLLSYARLPQSICNPGVPWLSMVTAGG